MVGLAQGFSVIEWGDFDRVNPFVCGTDRRFGEQIVSKAPGRIYERDWKEASHNVCCVIVVPEGTM